MNTTLTDYTPQTRSRTTSLTEATPEQREALLPILREYLHSQAVVRTTRKFNYWQKQSETLRRTQHAETRLHGFAECCLDSGAKLRDNLQKYLESQPAKRRRTPLFVLGQIGNEELKKLLSLATR